MPLSLRGRWTVLAALPLATMLASACGSPVDEVFDLECPGVSPHKANVQKVYVVGHRGAAAFAIENTIPSMERAMADGADAVEIDLSMTKDGHIILWHDWDPDSQIARFRQAGLESKVLGHPSVPSVGKDMRRPIDELTLEEVRANFGYAIDDEDVDVEIPTLEQFLDWTQTASRLQLVFFDIKIPEGKKELSGPMIDKLFATVRARNPSWGYLLTVNNDPVYDRISSQMASDPSLSFDVDPGVVVADDQACKDSSSAHASKRGAGYATTVLPTGWTPQAWKTLKTLLTCDLDARDKGAGVPVKVFAATIDDEDKMKCLLDIGVDGLVTDDPAKMRALVDGKLQPESL